MLTKVIKIPFIRNFDTSLASVFMKLKATFHVLRQFAMRPIVAETYALVVLTRHFARCCIRVSLVPALRSALRAGPSPF